ncbi:alanyl-tRNA synthetase [Pullulanibacillus pueri]|uniref:Alanyl-tRNA editing protein n=1 Tax=Pullulanibacillus pueri TaxID=1437324 RepID=A0A8J3EKH9_9BACL|nr:DHHA1 domain-containing protein [Pullulanibacillus pueri]MBM7681169.1 alanyl-tRNA synthetase [Pullulanibacillus pueri]GGH77317.1 alanyl-tRNA editing protein [Pullulanibacillus pueri]
MTQLLYYDDAYIQKFTAKIIQNGQDDKGYYSMLDQTAFYPTGGGQPFDTGLLNGIPVINVEKINGEIRHYTSVPLQALEGTEVEGVVDWERRFDHMQQHAGQHLLSAIFADHYGFKTVSFHLGRESSTIDIDTESLSEETVHKVEEMVQTIIYQHRPITTVWPEGDSWQQYPLRKPPTVNEAIRLVIIEGIDYNACGGTHPSTTGEIGPLKVLSWERQKHQTRVTFVCGWRAVQALDEKHTITQRLSQTLSSQEHDLPEAVEQLLVKQKELEKTIEDQEQLLLTYEVKERLAEATNHDGHRLVTLTLNDRPVKTCQKLVTALTDTDPHAIVLMVVQNKDRLHVIAARGTEPHYNMNQLIQPSLSLINGKGGGKPERAQGGGEAVVTPEYVLKQLMTQLQETRKVEG